MQLFVDYINPVFAVLSGAVLVCGCLGLMLAGIRAVVNPEQNKEASKSHVASILLMMILVGSLGLIASWLFSVFAAPNTQASSFINSLRGWF